MGHTIDFVIWWFVWAAVIGVIAGGLGLLWRRRRGREWSDLVIFEGAVAIGLVLSFVGAIIALAMPS